MQMAFSQKRIATGAIWTVATHGVSVAIRFVVNVILSRLVSPEVLGTLMVINTLKVGMELVTDVGIGQNIVISPNSEKRSFRDTAWTFQVLRGFLLFGLLSLAAYPLAQLYDIPALAIQLSAVSIVIIGMGSLSIYYLQRRIEIVRLNLFDLAMDVAGSIVAVVLTFMSPTIWGLIIANIIAIAIRAGMAYLLPDARNWFAIHKEHAREILSLGKWIFLSSLLSFLSFNFDKLFLAQALPLAVVGVYSIARGIADLPTMVAGRLSHQLVFPLIAAHKTGDKDALRRHISPLRMKLLLLLAFGVAAGVSLSDIAIELVYDDRYQDAGWMLAVLLFGVWMASLSVINDYTLLGLGKPVYGAFGNFAKLLCLVVAMTLGTQAFGLPGALVAIVLGEFLRYVPAVIGLHREGLSFVRQDLLANALMLLLVAFFLFLRHQLGFGSPFEGMPALFAS